MGSCEFVHGFITFYSRYKRSLTAYLTISALFPGLHKIPETLDLGIVIGSLGNYRYRHLGIGFFFLFFL